jgi:hypothetical protein
MPTTMEGFRLKEQDGKAGCGWRQIRLLSKPRKGRVDTVLFNLTFRDQAEQSFTLRFAPIALIPRRRIALQKVWFDYLAQAINSLGSASPLSTK